MSAAALAVIVPLLAAPVLGFAGTPLAGAWANGAICLAVWLLTLAAVFSPGDGLVHADTLGMIFGILTGFIALTTALANIGFVRGESAANSARSWRLHHALYQVILGATLLGFYADNIGLLWLAVEGATMAGAFGLILPPTPKAVAAAWNDLRVGVAGLALALFGTMLIYLAAQTALGPGVQALSFAALNLHAARLDGALMSLAFVFLLFGYGMRAALLPLHGALPDATARGPIPLTTMRALLPVNVALIAILRFRHLLAANHAAGGQAMQPDNFLIALGLASIFLTCLSLARRGDARWFFGASSMAQSGIAAFAFGIGGAVSIFAGLLQMMLATLINAAVFQALSRAAALRGSAATRKYRFFHLRGLLGTNRWLGWALGGAIFALAGLPPSGLFASEFLIFGQTVQRAPWLAFPFGFGLLLYATAIIRTIGALVFGPPPAAAPAMHAGSGIFLVNLHLALVLILAFAMPKVLLHALSNVAALLS